jgi:hypothetical protein
MSKLTVLLAVGWAAVVLLAALVSRFGYEVPYAVPILLGGWLVVVGWRRSRTTRTTKRPPTSGPFLFSERFASHFAKLS